MTEKFHTGPEKFDIEIAGELEVLIEAVRKENKPMAEYLVNNLCFQGCVTFKKDDDLTRLVKWLISKKHYPIIDTTLGLVIGVCPNGSHSSAMSVLKNYHQGKVGKSKSSASYLQKGHGYYMSSAFSGFKPVITVDPFYIQDIFDEELFKHFKTIEPRYAKT